jgi:hypothetical protein
MNLLHQTEHLMKMIIDNQFQQKRTDYGAFICHKGCQCLNFVLVYKVAKSYTSLGWQSDNTIIISKVEIRGKHIKVEVFCAPQI